MRGQRCCSTRVDWGQVLLPDPAGCQSPSVSCSFSLLLAAPSHLLPLPRRAAGNPETLNWLFAADREAMRAMLSLMRSADMDAARLGLQARRCLPVWWTRDPAASCRKVEPGQHHLRTTRCAVGLGQRLAACSLACLQFTEMVLRLLDNGEQAVEEADGIDAMEAVQFGAVPPELQRMAAALVDKYFGADNEP